MIFEEFRKIFFDVACFASNQVYAWRPGFDKNNLGRWVSKGLLIKLRNNFYCFPENLGEAGFEWYVANRIYRPSYISLHSALSFYGLIPEAVVQITSVSSLKTVRFENRVGSFSYHTVRPDLMFGFELKLIGNSRSLQMAKPEKALLDLLYLYPFYNTAREMEALRFDSGLTSESLDAGTIRSSVEKFRNKALERRVELFIKTYGL